MNIAVILSYDGTAYNGWQIQKNGPSIQESMETAVFRVLGQKVHCLLYTSGQPPAVCDSTLSI